MLESAHITLSGIFFSGKKNRKNRRQNKTSFIGMLNSTKDIDFSSTKYQITVSAQAAQEIQTMFRNKVDSELCFQTEACQGESISTVTWTTSSSKEIIGSSC